MLTNPLRYDTQQDVKLRLHGSIIRYKGIPVQAQLYGSTGLKVLVTPLSPQDYDTIAPNTPVHSSDVELDISSPPLGYMNLTERAVYIQRIPLRKQTQGFSTSSAAWLVDDLGSFSNAAIIGTLNSPYMADCICRRYPDGLQALTKLLSNRHIRSIAFHHRFSLMKDELGLIKLRHMGRSIGFLKPDTNQLKVSQEFDNLFFKDILNQNGFELA